VVKKRGSETAEALWYRCSRGAEIQGDVKHKDMANVEREVEREDEKKEIHWRAKGSWQQDQQDREKRETSRELEADLSKKQQEKLKERGGEERIWIFFHKPFFE